MREKINLTEVSNELYDRIVGNKEGFRHIDRKEYKQFMSKNARYLKKILEALTISEYERFLKPGFDTTANGYEFSVKDMAFLKELLHSYTSNSMLELRRGHMENVPDRFVVWIVEGMYKVFLNNDIPDKDINKIVICMSNRTDYPVRKRFCDIADFGYCLEELASNVFKPRWMTNLTGNDNCVWLDAFKKDAKAFFEKWSYIYDSMGEERQEEVNNIGEENYYRMTDNDIFRAEVEWALSKELSDAIRNDTILKDLNKKRDDAINSKTGFDTERVDYIANISQRISKRRVKVEQETFRKYLGDIDVPEESEIKRDSDFDDLMESEELLKQAIEDYKQSTVPVSFPLEDLPDINFDELRKEMKMRQ
ncbi:hypothetical protein DWC20_05955 [Clostridium botulinum]|uniref:hypothetical protein n=1 Tax=Clostridium botulinum TaxID=1491 RepID=UPI00035E36C3|nr:hypothetical protein [Clostridium botulinum]MBN1035094.1 hypothetical protein [Clostridium botulinum]